MNKYYYKIFNDKPIFQFLFPFKAFVLRRILALFFPEILNGLILKSRVLTLSHVTIFFLIFRKF